MPCERCTQAKDDVRRYQVKKGLVTVERDLCGSCREATAATYKVRLAKEQPVQETEAPEAEAEEPEGQPEADAPNADSEPQTEEEISA